MTERHARVEVAITCDPVLFDDFAGILTVAGFDGFWEDGTVLRAYVAEKTWTDEARSALQASLDHCAASRNKPNPTLIASAIKDRNWNEAWEATIRPIRVTDRIVIAPTWHPHEPRPGDIVLTIDPKMSFGTGYHETTRLMLRLLERHVRPDDTVLDVGTGTGVLAIAALKLGAASAIGVDNDAWSFENARENGALNGVASRFTARLGELAEVTEGPFGLVLANIQKNVIESLLPGLVERAAPDGRLLFSGLLLTDRDPLLVSFAGAGLRVIEELTENEWIAFATYRRH
jgi:ribosomal protein L11 methyltransferase